MKPEPLKNKRLCIISEHSEEYFEKDAPYFKVEDVKSAVEWLKNMCYSTFPDGSMETKDDLTTLEMIMIIDEAFEDVMEK